MQRLLLNLHFFTAWLVLLATAALLFLPLEAAAQRRGGNVSGYDPQAPRHAFSAEDPFWLYFRKPQGKRGLGGDPVPCCAEDPGQQPRK